MGPKNDYKQLKKCVIFKDIENMFMIAITHESNFSIK